MITINLSSIRSNLNMSSVFSCMSMTSKKYTKGTVLLVCFQCVDTLVFVLKHAEGMSLRCDVICALAYCGWHESSHIIKAHTDCTDLTGFLCGWEISRMDKPSQVLPWEGLPTTQQTQQEGGFNESWDAGV